MKGEYEGLCNEAQLRFGQNFASSGTHTRNTLILKHLPLRRLFSEVSHSLFFFQIRRQGGRCTRLGGIQRRAICLSGGVFDFVPECESVLAEREALADQENTTPEQ